MTDNSTTTKLPLSDHDTKLIKDTPKEKAVKDPVYTVDDAIEKMGFGPFQLIIFSFCGLLWTADAMEVMILSVLSPAVKCEWGLSGAEEAVITSVVFAGSLVGSLCWGLMGDNCGRRTALFFANIVILVSGVLSAVQLTPDDARYPGYPWMLLCRFGVGFGAAGITQVGPYFIEFLPRKTRAVCILLVSGWWAVGTMFGSVIALGVMRPGGLGWHWYLGICATPLALSLLYFLFIPESARYYLVQGKVAKAERVLKRVAWFNFKKLPEGRLITTEESESVKQSKPSEKLYGESESSFYDNSPPIKRKGKFISDSTDETDPLLISNKQISEPSDFSGTSKAKNMIKSLPLLFKNGMWKVTILLSFLWFGSAWLYYGNVLLTSTILQENPHCEAGLNSTLANETESLNETCQAQLDTSDYLNIMWTTGAELPGLLVSILIIEFVGRKLTMAINFAVIAVGYFLLFICTVEEVLTFFLFLIRAMATGVFQTMYVYTPEVYPTKVRGIGLAVVYAVARVGAISTPYVAQVLFRVSDYATISLYAGSSLLLIVLALLLPFETKGKDLRDEN